MKLTLTHRVQPPSKSVLDLIDAKLKALEATLKIDEAIIHVERSLTDSPPFSITFHLVTPGPDIKVSSSDHTQRAAVLKAFKLIDAKLDHRDAKRVQRKTPLHITTTTRRS